MSARAIRYLATLAALALGTSCQQPSGEVAPAGARPAVRIAVGPTPGAGAPRGQAVSNPYAEDRVATVEGLRLFGWFNCAGCHGEHGGGGMGPSLRDESWIYGGADADIFDSIAEGRAHGMPAWGTKLPEEVIWKIVAYIKSMRTPHEPSAPDAAAE